MIGTQNIRFADKASEGSHVGAINVDCSITRLLEAIFLLAQYAFWINDHAMPALRPVAHEPTHVNERSRCRMILRLGVAALKSRGSAAVNPTAINAKVTIGKHAGWSLRSLSLPRCAWHSQPLRP
jgi:hypothetical protein